MPKAKNKTKGCDDQEDATETFDAIHQLTQLLDIPLDSEALGICVQLLQAGVQPDALAHIVKELITHRDVTPTPPDNNTDRGESSSQK